MDNIYLISAACASLSEGCRANPIRLTDNPALAKINSGITWSPDGQRLAFVTDIAGQTVLYVMRADGSNQKRLTDQLNVGYDITWSPDGRWLAFLAYFAAKTKASLYLISAEGAPLIQLTDNAAGLSVEWLPHPAPKFLYPHLRPLLAPANAPCCPKLLWIRHSG